MAAQCERLLSAFPSLAVASRKKASPAPMSHLVKARGSQHRRRPAAVPAVLPLRGSLYHSIHRSLTMAAIANKKLKVQAFQDSSSADEGSGVAGAGGGGGTCANLQEEKEDAHGAALEEQQNLLVRDREGQADTEESGRAAVDVNEVLGKNMNGASPAKGGVLSATVREEEFDSPEALSRTNKGAASLLPLHLEQEKAISTGGRSISTWQKRWTIVGLCFFAFLLCNMDRVNMSIAILPMSEQYNWTPSTMGLVQSSFFWGYLLTQVAGGIWADSIGGKQVLGFGVIWWSLATTLTPIAASLGLPALLMTRACMGVGEGVAMPAMNTMLSKWVPVSERSRSLALVYSGMYSGSVAGLSISPALIHSLGWPSVFYSFGVLGIVWFLVWQRKAFSTPAEDPTVSDVERTYIANGVGTAAPLRDGEGSSGAAMMHGHGGGGGDRIDCIPWRLLLSKAPVWAIIISHFCHNWGTFILLTWMPTYYHDVLGFDLTQSGLFSVLPWMTMAVSANVGGWIADSLISRGVSITLVRKVMQSIGFLGPALCLSLLSSIKSPALAVLLLMCSQGSDAFSQSGLYSNHQDIGPRYAGVLLGISNTAGVLAGVIGTFVTGQILQNGSWDDVFKVAVALYLVGTLVWNTMATGERVFD
eukprot:TRINITY_DN2494_c0_g1_i1.p1 TRINITY_DN2494_c0_g1~~TRINITY_DN2494_c0_g1_i1.p1  ORF type:complete len:673 (+),score=143.62 TRINITY_DN2494_c0_g1_i1:86-2020(+)